MTVKRINLMFKSIIVILGVSGLSLLVFAAPLISQNLEETNLNTVIQVMLWITAIPVLFILMTLWKISSRLLNETVFSKETSEGLIKIAYASLIESGIYGVTLIFGLFQLKGNYPYFLVCFFFFFLGLVIAVIASLLSYIFRMAHELKDENDLTI